jgi:hypothetical protein
MYDQKYNYLMTGGAGSVWWVILLLLLCVGGLIVGGYFLFRSKPKPPVPPASPACDPVTKCNAQGLCNADGTCKCNTGYTGLTCLIPPTLPPTSPPTCNRDTTCNKRGNCNADGSCACDAGYSGAKCIRICNRDTTCHGHGNCNTEGNCVCDTGYSEEEDCRDNTQSIIFYSEPEYTGISQTFPWDINSTYYRNDDCKNSGTGTKYKLNFNPKSIKWVGVSGPPAVRLWLTGWYGGGSDTACGPSNAPWFSSAVTYNNLTLANNSNWLYANAMGFFHFKQ